MNTILLKIITPKKIILKQDVNSVTIPTVNGQITVLPKHIPLFSIINEGIININVEKSVQYFSIGGGYIETDGKQINILVSRAYGQNEIDEEEILNAKKEALKLVQIAKTDEERQQALNLLRRSTVDLKLLEKVKKTRKPLSKYP